MPFLRVRQAEGAREARSAGYFRIPAIFLPKNRNIRHRPEGSPETRRPGAAFMQALYKCAGARPWIPDRANDEAVVLVSEVLYNPTFFILP
jgi:hypothetical protein